MSLIKNDYGELSGGGALVETVLWTNSAPTSSFAIQTVTLSDSITNYDYLKFTFNVSTSNSTKQSLITSVSDFRNSLAQDGKALVSYTSRTSNYYSRGVVYNSDTEIIFRTSYIINGSGSSDTTNIPLKIIGVKKSSDEVKIAEIWDHQAYNDVTCYDPINDNILQNNVSIYNSNVSGEYLNVAYSSSIVLTYKALKKCHVVAIIGTQKSEYDLDVNSTFTDSTLNNRHLIFVYPA